MKRKRSGLARPLMLAAYVYYVLSNATVLHDVAPNAVKHAFFVALALLSFVVSPRQALKATLIASPIAAIYFIGGANLFGVMVAVFAASLPLVAHEVHDIVSRQRWRVVVVLLALALIPAVIGIDVILENGLFDTTYGRERLLLGYFHPKEAGICFGIPILLALMMSGSTVLKRALIGAGFVFVVGSRNVALVITLAALARRFPRTIASVFVVLVVGFGLWLALDPAVLDALDLLVSLRLTVWSEALSDPTAANDFDALEGERFAVDNFFVEAFIYAGWLAVPLVGLWFGTAARVAAKARGRWPLVALFCLLMFASFDSGIASTGNLMHAFLWAVVLVPGFVETPVRRRSAVVEQDRDRGAGQIDAQEPIGTRSSV